MVAELRGSVPKLPYPFARTLVNRAWRVVRESNLWSFQLFESSWISPPSEQSGKCAVTQGLPDIVFDATARAALLADQIAQPYSLFTQRQFRVGIGGIYNIISLDANFVTNGQATLDRPFADATNAAAAYIVYQLYYPAPMEDFLVWMSVRNPQMFIDLDLTTTREQIDAMDPQRSWYQFPTRVVPWGRDTRVGSATLGWPLFELWGQPVAPFVYQCYGIRRGTPLVAPADTLPTPVSEELVLFKAREYAYEWAEANKDTVPRAQGPDFRFLLKQMQDDFRGSLTLYRKQDKEFVNNWFAARRGQLGGRGLGYYNTISGTAGPYPQP